MSKPDLTRIFWSSGHIRVFPNVVVPAGQVALVIISDHGPETVWIGPIQDAPEYYLSITDEAHINPLTGLRLSMFVERDNDQHKESRQ